MPQVKFTEGPDSVDVKVGDGQFVHVERGDAAEFPAAIADQLVEQGWERADGAGPQVSEAAAAKADELGVDLDQVKGSGANGNVIVKDVVAAAEAAESTEPEAEAAGESEGGESAPEEE